MERELRLLFLMFGISLWTSLLMVAIYRPIFESVWVAILIFVPNEIGNALASYHREHFEQSKWWYGLIIPFLSFGVLAYTFIQLIKYYQKKREA